MPFDTVKRPSVPEFSAIPQRDAVSTIRSARFPVGYPAPAGSSGPQVRDQAPGTYNHPASTRSSDPLWFRNPVSVRSSGRYFPHRRGTVPASVRSKSRSGWEVPADKPLCHKAYFAIVAVY